MIEETLIPKIGVVTDIRKDTPDVKTFRVVGTDGKKPFAHMPGQCAMVSIPGVGNVCSRLLLRLQTKNIWNFLLKNAVA